MGSHISFDSDVYFELGGFREKVNSLRDKELTLGGVVELLLCHSAVHPLDPDFVRDFEPIAQPGRPRKEKRPSTLLKMRGTLEGRLYPH